MFQRETVLRKLQKLLSGKDTRLFENQVSFYNALFGMTDPEAFPEAMVRELESCRKRPAIETFFGMDWIIAPVISENISMTSRAWGSHGTTVFIFRRISINRRSAGG